MKTHPLALVAALALTPACATLGTQPLHLPPRTAPLEHRVAAYREHLAMPHMGFAGWGMRLGDGEILPVDTARTFLANAPEADAVMRDHDRRNVIGWSLIGGGLALRLGSLAVLPFALDRDDPSSVPVLPFALITLGAGASIPGTFLLAGAQRRIPMAAEEYNRWLWRALALPRAGDLGAPPVTSTTPTPWSTP